MKQLAKRLLRLAFVLIAVTALTFITLDLLPGDIAEYMTGDESSLEDIEAIREDLGLNKNILVRYGEWLKNAARGDLGKSLRTEQPVAEAILSRLPVTLELIAISLFISLALAVPAGIISAYKEGSWIDKTLNCIAFSGSSIPVFIMGILFIYLFALKLSWLPATGYIPLSDGFFANIKTFILPGLSLGLVEWVPLMRVLRTDMIATLKEDYILAARAKGHSSFYILFAHALRPSSFTLITILGLQIGHLISRALIVEMIFALPGIGRLLVNAIYGRDFIIVQGCVIVIAISYVFVNFIVDILYALLDPRIRQENAHV